MLNFISRFLNKIVARKSVIIGTDYHEYMAFKELQKQNIPVLYFISDDPWKHNSDIEQVPFRYPIELAAICHKYNVRNVYYYDDTWLKKIPALPQKTKLIKID